MEPLVGEAGHLHSCPAIYRGTFSEDWEFVPKAAFSFTNRCPLPPS